MNNQCISSEMLEKGSSYFLPRTLLELVGIFTFRKDTFYNIKHICTNFSSIVDQSD